MGAARTDIDRRSRSCLAALGLAGTADRLTSNLSGGQRQRVAIARMLAIGSPLLFLDEPTSDLDASNRDTVVRLLRQQAEQGAVVVVVSHDPAIVDLSDTIYALTPDGTLEQ